SLGLKDARTIHKRLSLGWSRSYHFEVDAPAEIRVPAVRLRAQYIETGKQLALIGEAGEAPVIDVYARRPTEQVLAGPEAPNPKTRPPVLPDAGDDGSASALLALAHSSRPTAVNRADQGTGEVKMRLDPYGTFLVAVIISTLTAVLLLFARPRLAQLDGQTAAALLLALPVLTLGYLTRPGEHALATRLLTGVRLGALIVGICSLLVAGLLAGGFVHTGDSGSPGYRCQASVDDLPVKPSPHHTWKETQDPDEPELTCVNTPTAGSNATVPRNAQHIANGATIAASAIAALLILGWLSTRFRGGMLPEPRSRGDQLG
ncbi:MAG: hypothetical protein ACLQBB_02160, partial [Solirubrobacteraceae bacterium]